MKNSHTTYATLVGVLAIALAPQATAQQRREDHVIADFEGDEAVSGSKTSHRASVTVVDDVPKGGGRFAAKTVVDAAAGADKFFFTGHRVSGRRLFRHR